MVAEAHPVTAPQHVASAHVPTHLGLRRVLLGGILAFSASGCMTIETLRLTVAPPPPDPTVVKVGSARQTVEGILGEAVRKEANVYTYEYDTRHVGPAMGIFLTLGSAAMDFLSLGLFSAGHWVPFKQAEEARRASVSIVYGPKDTVIGVSHEEAEAQYLAWFNSSDRREGLERLCVAANAGYAPGAAVEAMRYWYGLWGTDVDRVEAYVWLRLAAFGGQRNATEILDNWAAALTGEQIAHAERLFGEWEPTHCQGPDGRALSVGQPRERETSETARAIPVSAEQVELADVSLHSDAGPALLTGRLRNRSPLVLTDLMIKISLYDGEERVGEAVVGQAADRFLGRSTGEKGINDMNVPPGEGREFAVRLGGPMPTGYKRTEFQVIEAWGTTQDAPAGSPEQLPARP